MATLPDPISVRLKPADAEMLRQLAKAAKVAPGEFLRQLIRESYESRLARMKTKAGFGFDLLALAAGGRRDARGTALRGKTGPSRKDSKRPPAGKTKTPAKRRKPAETAAKKPSAVSKKNAAKKISSKKGVAAGVRIRKKSSGSVLVQPSVTPAKRKRAAPAAAKPAAKRKGPPPLPTRRRKKPTALMGD